MGGGECSNNPQEGPEERARRGIAMLLNNNHVAAEALFMDNQRDVRMAAGVVYFTLLNALLDCNKGRLEEALKTLGKIEARYTNRTGWRRSIRSMMYGEVKSLDQTIEERIVVADTLVCQSVLLFMQCKATSFVKGGWCLRRAWRLYKHTYAELAAMYADHFDDHHPPESIKSDDHQSSSPLTYVGSALYESATSLMGRNKKRMVMKPETLLRLLSAVSFGYGLLKLGVTFVPDNAKRWVSMLGFEGDIATALEILEYSRTGRDMRSPLASFVLLGFYTIPKSIFCSDTSSNSETIEKASSILNDEHEFANSAYFIFFRGRLERKKSNIPAAIKAYKLSIRRVSIHQIKFYGFLELAWSHLMNFNFAEAQKIFVRMKRAAVRGKGMYAYLSMITAGAAGIVDHLPYGRVEIKVFLKRSNTKGTPMHKAIESRMETLPNSNECEEEWAKDPLLWKLYCFEMLYMWNTFNYYSFVHLYEIFIVCDCQRFDEMTMPEAIKGLHLFIKGAVCSALLFKMSTLERHLKSNIPKLIIDTGIKALRSCLEMRERCSDDIHVSRFARFELGSLLIKQKKTYEEGKAILMTFPTDYKCYDQDFHFFFRVKSSLIQIEMYEREIKKQTTAELSSYPSITNL